MTHGIYEFALTLPITQGARRTAQAFASEQPTPAKATQVRLNTLAVLVTQSYLQLMDIPTDLAISDSWDPVMRVCLDVADLDLPGVGRLECRPVVPESDHYFVPAETWEDRVGYVVVQVDEAAQEAQILGFVPTVDDEELPLNTLRSPEDLLDHLGELRQSEAIAPNAILSTAQQTLVNLGTWLQTTWQDGQQAIAAGWLAVNEVLGGAELSPAYAFRRAETSVRRAKRVTLGNTAIALVVDVRANNDEQLDIRLQLHPIAPQTQLSPGLQLAVLDDTEEILVDATATGMEDFLELQIEGTSGEAFWVQVKLDADQETQAFVI
jgi:hypothetical protein